MDSLHFTFFYSSSINFAALQPLKSTGGDDNVGTEILTVEAHIADKIRLTIHWRRNADNKFVPGSNCVAKADIDYRFTARTTI